MNEKLFVDGINAPDSTYNIICNENKDSYILELRSFIEKLWEDYQPYADRDFKQKIQEDFHSRFWEMYLTCTLLNKSLPIQRKTTDKGPDILIEDSNHRIWLEAIAPTSGADDNPDRVPNMKLGVASEVPDTEITLRYCSAISEKFDNKYKLYLAKNIISPTDSYVVAINSCKIRPAIMDMNDPPRIIKAVFPVGYWQYTIDKHLHKIVNSRLQFRPQLERASGSSVSTNLFLNPEYQNLSGILYSRASVHKLPKNMGEDFIFIHNPLATKNRVPCGYFKFGNEYIAKETGNNYVIECKKWN